MTTNAPITGPDRAALRVLYDAAIVEINTSRNTNLLTTDFYTKTGDAVFDAGCLALSDAATDTRRMHTVPAPAGGGKTSFAYALALAVTRYAENRPNAPCGVVFVVEQIESANKAYQELSAHLPGKVHIWTSDHDVRCKQPEKVKNPPVRSTPSELRNFPIVIVTHKFYLGTRGHHARTMVRNGVQGVRALTVVDEKPDEAPAIDIMLSEAQTVYEALLDAHPETKAHLDALLKFMQQYNYAAPNALYRRGIEVDQDTLIEELSWFKTREASLVRKSAKIPGVEKFFAFAKALVVGRACVATNKSLAYFFGYDEHRVIDLTAGTILLDATADIDGISSIVPWRKPTETPRANYANLEIICVPQHTKQRLSEYLKTAANQRAYSTWILETIKQHMRPGEKGLVVAKKTLFDVERIPQWPEGDPRFKEPKVYTEEYGWDIGGRSLCATYWGTGVGSNAWSDADVVFLFDEFILPRRISVAHTQGLRGHHVDQGDLGSMRTLHSKAEGVDSIAEGHVLRWTKQLALRGKARVYDENGICGKQRLVVGSDLKRFMANVTKLFPGAPRVRYVGNHDNNTTYANKILLLLNDTSECLLSTKVLSRIIGKPWRDVRPYVLTQGFRRSIEAIGWRYNPLKGRSGARFERIIPEQELGVLSGLG